MMVKDCFEIKKSDNEKQFVFGWANISIRKDGEQIHDYQGDMIDPEELESAAYEHVLKFRSAGERHDPNFRNKGRLIESVVFTKEKLEAMGIPEGTVPLGWWVGYHIEDQEAWEKIKKGEYRMFSIEGQAQREPVVKAQGSAAKLFKTVVEKFNPYHGKDGRFTWAGGGVAHATIFTKDPSKQHWADKAKAKAQENMKNKTPIKVITYTNANGLKREYKVLQDGTVLGPSGQESSAKADQLIQHLNNMTESFGGSVEVTNPNAKPVKAKPVDGKDDTKYKKVESESDGEGYAEADYKRYDFTSEQSSAIRLYTSSAYESINSHLRTGSGVTEKNKAAISQLTDAIDKTSTQEPIITYRGVGSDAVKTFLSQGGASDPRGLVGATITDKAFVSTSLLKNVATETFGEGYLMEIKVPKGSKALMPNGQSYYSNEVEVILQRGAKFKVTGTRYDGGSTVIECEYASPKNH